MFKKKREFKNALTNLISEDEITLEGVILHHDLSVTLRNGPAVLLDFLFSQKNYIKVIDYALFDKKAEENQFKDLSIRQINNNAANILSYPNERIKKKISDIKDGNGKPLLLQKFEEFINDKKLSHDQFYAGHFERIYENILNGPGSDFDTFFNDEFANILIPFLAENVIILPYKELLQILLDDLIEKIDPDFLNTIIKTMLQYSAFFSYVTYCKQSPNINSLSKSYNQSLKYFKQNQPVNNHKESLPIPEFKPGKYLDNNLKKNENLAKRKGEKLFPKNFKSRNPNDFNYEDSQISAYFFLSSIRIAFINNYHNETMQDDDLIELLLYCAVFSDPESLSSAEAFKILENIYYGIYKENDFTQKCLVDPYEDEKFYKLIDEYAGFLSYNTNFLTKQHVCAFPLFWNHRYSDLIDDPFFVNIDPVLNMTEYHEYPEQLTPFLSLRPFLLSDPPFNMQLNYSFLKIIDFLIKKKDNLIGDEKKEMKLYDKQTQEEIRNIIFIIYEFIQRKFPFNTKKNNYYDSLYQMVPYFPQTIKEAEHINPVRSLLNGAIYKSFQMILDSSFFIINDKASLLLYDIEEDIENDVVQRIMDYNRRKPVLE